MASNLNTHQLCLSNHLTMNHIHPQINQNPLNLILNPSFSQIKTISNHNPQKPKPSLVSIPPSSLGWAWAPTGWSGRADFRVWSKRRAGSKGKTKRSTVMVECTKCSKNRYTTEKHSLNTPGKLELSKYCPKCRLHTIHKEIK